MVYANSSATTEASLYHCVRCSKDFRRDEDLYKHLCNSGHPYCFYCGPDNIITSSLSHHFKTIHSNFTCPECPRVFYLRNAWKNHMSSHWDYQEPRRLFLHDVMVPGESLQDFADRLSPSKEFYESCSEIVSRIEKFMKHNTSFKNGSILMAGSVGKRTALGDGADIDMMYYLNETSLDDMMNTLPTIIKRLKQHVQNGDLNWATGLKFEKTTPFSVQFKLSIGNQPHIPVDLLPVVHILKPNTKANREELYTRMKTMDRKKQTYCRRCLSKVQVDFVRKVPRNLKDVIRVLKSWVKKIKKEERCGSVLSYFCELVVIRTWMNQGEPANQHIDLHVLVKLVLYELCFCETIRITWPEHYQHHDFTVEIDGPMVLDPANPFCNVAPKIQHAAVISRNARQLLSKQTCSVMFVLDRDLDEISLNSEDNEQPAVAGTRIPPVPDLSLPSGAARTPERDQPRGMYTSGTILTEQSVKLEMGEVPNVRRCRCSRKCCRVLILLTVLVLVALGCFLAWYLWPRPETSQTNLS